MEISAFPGTDDQLAAAKTDAQGNFQLNGGVGSVFGMDVHFKVHFFEVCSLVI